MLSVCLETYSNTTNVAAKHRKEKKENPSIQLVSEKARLQLVSSMCAKLKTELGKCEIALGECLGATESCGF